MSNEDDSEADLWAEYSELPPPIPPPSSSFNHGGPGVCRLCYPKGITADARKSVQPTEQGELQL